VLAQSREVFEIMKTFEVSLDVLSAKPLVELERMVGIAADDGSHSAGDKRGRTKQWPSSRLRVDSQVEEHEPVAAHVQSLLARVPDDELPAEMELMLTIAVFTDSPMSSVVLDPRELKVIAERGWRVYVVTYFCARERPGFQRLRRLAKAVRAWRRQ
jgi:hypothetical protein